VTSFPRQHARTRRFTLGVPRGIVAGLGPSGPLVLFLRTDTGSDPVTHLWRHDPATGTTSKLVDARALDAGDDELPAEERARRERAREQAGGIVAYSVDDHLAVAAFGLGGRLFTLDVATGAVAEQPTVGPAFDPQVAPTGDRVAYHATGGVHVVDLAAGPAVTGTSRTLTPAEEPEVGWGRAEFVAAEEMGRTRGFWWSGDGAALAVTRVDESAVPLWTIADPADPARPPVRHRYPVAGSTNASVTLWLVDAVSSERVRVALDPVDDEYVARVAWGDGPLTVLTQPRDQRSARVQTVDPATGGVAVVRRWTDADWVELVPGSPRWCGDRLVTVEDRAELGPSGTRVLCVDGEPVSPAGLQVRELVGVSPDHRSAVQLLASPDADPTRVDVYELELGPPHLVLRSATGDAEPGLRRLVPSRPPVDPAEATRLLPSVTITATLATAAPTVAVRLTAGGRLTAVERPPGGASWSVPDGEQYLEVVAESPVLVARPRLLVLGERRLACALFLPTDDAGDGRLPVLLDPYGGPHAQRVVAAQAAHLTSQWFADQGFAVLVVDGRGTPGRGPRWERAVAGDLASAVLADQLEALHAAATVEPRLDLDRVAIRGWSFGGYLAALAVLRRPQVVHAAVAGAPVTDWRLYDTHYTERYLGHPDRHPEAYRVSSLIDADASLLDAAPWDPDRPPALLVIHGLADDNVVAAHALRLSSALLADGRAHHFLPLSGVTHMTPQEVVAEQLLVHQARFLHDALRRG
jgi:dipeptidyl-peptidase 4